MTSRYALTLGEQSEIHVGCPIYGNGLAKSGFSVKELQDIAQKFGNNAIIKVLSDLLPEDKRLDNEACVLHIKNGINKLMDDESYANKMLAEQQSIEYDKFYFDNRQKKKLNKIARHNTVFGDKHINHSEDYSQSTVIGYDEVPYFKKLRAKLPQIFRNKAKGLNAEGNYYYSEKSGIGFHGDSERKIVICCSLGTSTTLRFYWREPNSSDVFSTFADFKIEHGDIYVMSEKASGYDWKMRSKYRLVHGAGAAPYIDVDKKKPIKKPAKKITVKSKSKSITDF
jgi:alkylated DNA repair dioxygenase AlkB